MLRSSSARSSATRQCGFTLQESLITLAIGSTLVVGGSGLASVLQENTQTVAANDLVAHLNYARSEAIKRHAKVTVCPSKNGSSCAAPETRHTVWQHGWLVYVDANNNGAPEVSEILRAHEGSARDLVVQTSRARDDITYQPTGSAGGSTITFALCDSRGAASARYVTVSNTGRARVSQTTTSTIRC